MDISKRIQLSRVLLQIEENQKLCERLGMKDTSYYESQNIETKGGCMKMAKWQVILHYSDGTTDIDDNYGDYYDSEEEAEAAGEESLSCMRQGAETLELSNPGDYSFSDEDFEDDYYEVEEVD